MSKAEMKKLDLKTDGSTVNIIEQNVAKLKELFPDIVTEGKIDFDALRETLGDYIDDRQERYNFTWNGKTLAKHIAQTPSTGTLRPCPEESINWDTTQNLFIEGDNLEVLKLLQKSYHKRVKMIYIDPPYNTGKQFIYPDKFQDNLGTYLRYTGQVDDEGFKLSPNTETSGRYHTNWLNMMLPRLKLARNLLRDDGVIFVSIDFRESANLRGLMNEVFGEENLVFDVAVVNNMKGRNDRVGIATAHEQLLIYRKHEYVPRGLALTPEMRAKYSEIDEAGHHFRWRDLRKRGSADTRAERPKMYFPFYVNPATGSVAAAKDSLHTVKVFPLKSDGTDGRWRWGPEKAYAHTQIMHATQPKGKDRWNISYRVYLESEGKTRRSTPKSAWIGPRHSTDAATKSLAKLFPGIDAKKFTPKAVGFLRDIVDQSAQEGDVILDFFAGTGTLAEAILRQNLEERLNRPFILIQLPEPITGKLPTSCRGIRTVADLCKERIRRVIAKIEADLKEKAKEAKEKLPGAAEDVPELDLGFKVFKLDASNIKPWDADFDNVKEALLNAVENIKPDRTEADVLYELLLKYGLDLAVPIEQRKIDGKTVYIIGAGALIVCLADKVSLDVVEGIAKLKTELKPEVMRVVFKDAGFKDDVVKTNAVQILRQAGIEDVKSL
jgi:adenine-specific DNA-methyltransferase